MKTKEIYKEVVCNFFDEEGKCWCVDAWTDPEKEDNGCVVARIDGESGNVYYTDDAAKCSPLAQEVIQNKQKEVREERDLRKRQLGETMVLLTSEVWRRVYDKMREPNCSQLAQEIVSEAITFEKYWQEKPFEEKDGYYLDEIDAFAEKLTEKLTNLLC